MIRIPSRCFYDLLALFTYPRLFSPKGRHIKAQSILGKDGGIWGVYVMARVDEIRKNQFLPIKLVDKEKLSKIGIIDFKKKSRFMLFREKRTLAYVCLLIMLK